MAAAKPRSRKRTYVYLLRSMRTLRFLLRRARRDASRASMGANVLRLTANAAAPHLYAKMAHALAA